MTQEEIENLNIIINIFKELNKYLKATHTHLGGGKKNIHPEVH